jgi:ABC-type multidrug transport system fused ATPase/permease subunit
MDFIVWLILLLIILFPLLVVTMTQQAIRIWRYLPRHSLRRLTHHLGPYILAQWGSLVCAGVGILVEAMMDLLKPWPLKWLVDGVLGMKLGASPGWLLQSNPYLNALIVAGIVVAISVLDGMFSYMREYSLARAGQHMAFDLRTALYNHLHALGFGFYNSQRIGDLINRITRDIDNLQNFISDSLLTIASSLLVLLGMLGVMLWLDVPLTLIVVLLTPFMFALVLRYTTRIKQMASVQRTHEGEVSAVAQESLSSIRVVKAFGREDFELSRFLNFAIRSQEASLDVSQMEARFGWLVDIITALGMAGVIAFGVQRVLSNAITPGDLLVFTSYLKSFYRPMRDFSKEVNKASKALVRADYVVQVLETTPSVRDIPGAITAPRLRGDIVFKHVSFSYGREKSTLKDINFCVAPGQVVAMVGPTGAGKTTIANLVPRFYDPNSGAVHVDGTDIRRYTLRSLRAQISMVLQETVLFRANIAENIAYGQPSASFNQIVAAAKAAHADGFIRALPEGYNTIVGERGVTLSGGQRQRIAIARALVRNAPILLLDEPTVGLDAETEAMVWDALLRLMEGRTTLVIAHRLAMAQRADLILVVDHGHIIESGHHKELIRAGGLYNRLFKHQTSETARLRPATVIQ